MDGPVFEVVWMGTSGPACSETLQPQPVGKPGHVAVAVERVGDQVEAGQAGQLVEGPRGHAADQVPVQGQALEVVQAPEHCSVHHGDLILGKQSGRNNSVD